MQQARVLPNSTTLNALISSYGKMRNLPAALVVYRDMVRDLHGNAKGLSMLKHCIERLMEV